MITYIGCFPCAYNYNPMRYVQPNEVKLGSSCSDGVLQYNHAYTSQDAPYVFVNNFVHP